MPLFTALVQGVAMTASTAKTWLQIVPGTKPIRTVELGISFSGVQTTDNTCRVELVRQSTAGTSSALTMLKDRETDTSNNLCTALQSFTAEPTLVNAIRTWQMTPIAGWQVIQFQLGREIDAITNRLGVRVTPGATIDGIGDCYLQIDE